MYAIFYPALAAAYILTVSTAVRDPMSAAEILLYVTIGLFAGIGLNVLIGSHARRDPRRDREC